MATSQYQSVDPKLVAKKGKKPMSSVSTTQAPVFQSLETKSQQPQAPSSAGLPLIGGGQTIKGVGLQAVNTPVRSAMDNFTPISRQPSTQPTTQGSTQGPAQPTIQATTNARVRERLSKMGGDIVLRGKGLADIRATYPEFAHIDDETFKKIGGDIALRGKGIDDILQAYPELLVGGQVGERPRAEQGGVKGFLGEVAQPLKTLGQGLAGLTEKAGDYLMSSNDGTPVGIATDKAISEAGYQTNVTRGFVPQKTQEDIKQENKTLSQNILDTVEGTAYLAGQIYAPITSAIFQAGSKVPVVKDVLGKVGEGFSRVGEKLKYIPGYNQYRESLPPEDQNRLDALAGNMIAAFIGSKGKGKITQGDVKGYIMDNFGSPGSLDRAFGEQIKGTYKTVKGLLPKAKKPTPASIKVDVMKGLKPSTSKIQEAGGIDSYVDRAYLAAKTIADNKEIIEFVDADGNKVSGKTPETIQEFADAIPQAKRVVYQEYAQQAELAGKSSKVPSSTIVSELINLKNKLSKQYMTQSTIKYIDSLIEEIQNKGDMGVMDALDTTENLNAKLKAYMRNPNPSEVSNAVVDALINNQLKKLIDDTIESNLDNSSYKEGKVKYGALKTIEKDVSNRAVVYGRQNIKGFLDISDIFTAGEAIHALTTLSLPGALKSGTMYAIKEWFKRINSPDTRTKNIFKKVSQPQTIPTVEATTKQKYPIKLQSEGPQTLGATLPKPTVKIPPIIRETGFAKQPGTAKSTITVPKKEVVPVKDNSFNRMMELDTDPNYQKVGPVEPLSRAKQYETQYGPIQSVFFDGKTQKVMVNGKQYGRGDVSIFEKLDGDTIKANNASNKTYELRKQLQAIASGKGNKVSGSQLKAILDDLGIESVNDIPDESLQTILDLSRKQKLSVVTPQTIKNNALKQKGNGAKPKVGLGKETLEQNIDDSLIQEAGKYKSADEFVNSNKNQGYETSRMNKNYKSFIDSKEFKDRFGDSKAITRGGYVSPDRPTSYYHASPNKFDTFETRKNLIDKGIDMPDYRDTDSGIYFSTKPINDDYYGKNKYEVLLNIKNPFNTNSDISVLSDEKIAGYIRKGYDAVVSPTETVVFSPKQIKIITRNKEPVGQYKDYIRKIREQANKKPLPLKKK